MLRNKSGCIVNITSVIGPQKASPGLTAYGASKAGLVSFTKSLAKELASKQIRVNCVSPGFVKTDMTKAFPEDMLKKQVPLGRICQVEEVANAVNYLVSGHAKSVTGTDFVLDGGISL